MRVRLMAAAAVALLAGGAALLVLGRAEDGERSNREIVLPTRTISAGAVTVSIQPLVIGEAGARFRVAMDTHSVDLSFEPEASLQVGGTSWGRGVWVGDGPGGHHRQGELRFEPGGPPTGHVRLEIGGLSASAVAHWRVQAS